MSRRFSAAHFQLASLSLTLADLLTAVGRLEATAMLQQASLDALRATADAADLGQAAALLCNHFASVAPVEAVAFGQRTRRGEVELLAISGLAKVDRHSELARMFEAVMDESALSTHRDSPLLYSATNEAESPLGATARSVSTAMHVQDVLAIPFQSTWGAQSSTSSSTSSTSSTSATSSAYSNADGGECLGVWLVVGNRLSGHQAAYAELMKLVAPVLTRLHHQANEGGARGAARRATEWARSRPGRTTLLIALAALLIAPWPYTFRCDASLEPVTRRFVVAPYQGILEKQLVEAWRCRRGGASARSDGWSGVANATVGRCELSSAAN